MDVAIASIVSGVEAPLAVQLSEPVSKDFQRELLVPTLALEGLLMLKGGAGLEGGELL